MLDKNIPQEAAKIPADAIVEVDGYGGSQ